MSPEKQPASPEEWPNDLTCDLNDPEPHPVDPDNQTKEEVLIHSTWLKRNIEAISEGKHFSTKPGYVP